jgi:hypothetical protein
MLNYFSSITVLFLAVLPDTTLQRGNTVIR